MGFPHSSVGKKYASNAGEPQLRGLKQTLCAPGHRDPTETETELSFSVSCGGRGHQWTATGTGALGAADLVMA